MPDWQELDESQLIQYAKDGDSEAFGELYERYLQVIFRFVYSRLNDRLDAEDLTEEIFIRVWRSYRIMKNKASLLPPIYSA